MFERFTEPARQVVVFSQDEARALGHNYIGTEHLLLGLLREEQGLAARVLGELGVELELVRAQVARIVGGDVGEFTGGQIPFTPRSKKVLELALREARALNHQFIGTEHVLLGLVRENEGVAVKILRDFGADADAIRDAIFGVLSGPGGVVTTGPPMMTVPASLVHTASEKRVPPVALLVAGWVLFALALGIGVLVGWAIWG